MATNIRDFFLESNSVYNVTDEDYGKINILISAAKAFARSTHQCVYVIDYYKQNFLYVSENLSYWCGQTSISPRCCLQKTAESGWHYAPLPCHRATLPDVLFSRNREINLITNIPWRSISGLKKKV